MKFKCFLQSGPLESPMSSLGCWTLLPALCYEQFTTMLKHGQASPLPTACIPNT